MINREKCIVIQMMLRQSPKLKGLKPVQALQLFYKNKLYPEITSEEIKLINDEITEFLKHAEKEAIRGLAGAGLGKSMFDNLAKKFGFNDKVEKDLDEIEDVLNNQTKENQNFLAEMSDKMRNNKE